MEKIIEELSKKYKLPKIAVEQVIKSMFGFTADMMRKGDMGSISLMYLGKFCVKPGRKRFKLRYDKVREYLTRREKEIDETAKQDKRDNYRILESDTRKEEVTLR